MIKRISLTLLMSLLVSLLMSHATLVFAKPNNALAIMSAKDILSDKKLTDLVSMQTFAKPPSIQAIVDHNFDKKPNNNLDKNWQVFNLQLKPIDSNSLFTPVKDFYHLVDSKKLRVKDFPKINFSFVQDGVNLVPLDSSMQKTNHPQWEWQVSAGYQWLDKTNPNHKMMVFPFSLQERNANCTHNGVIKIVKNKQSKQQQAIFQIASETCAYFQFNWLGKLKVSLHESSNIDSQAATVITRFRHYRSSIKPVLSAKDLQQQFHNLSIEKLLPSDHAASSTSGLVIKGKQYRLNCDTRAGQYPFCDQLALPSFSTAKSLFAGMVLMRMQALVPGIDKLLVSKLIPECDSQKWKNVTLGDLLNMRSGIYRSKNPHADESSKEMLQFFLVETAAQKLSLACKMFTRKSQPGNTFHYHTSDTYLAGVMFNRIFTKISDQTDVYDSILAGEIWPRLNLSPLLDKTKRTYDSNRQAFTGWGLTYYDSDLVKLVDFLWQQDSVNAKSKILDQSLISQIMHPEQPAAARDAGSSNMRYNQGFWAMDVSQALGCKQPRWIPFMSGFGGISVVMVSPDLLYYNFSDNYRFEWLKPLIELNRVMDLCQAGKNN